MRLIDADALREKHCSDCKEEIRQICETDPVCGTMMWVAEEPTIDAVPVVRCKDCKHGVAYNRMDGQTGYYCHQPNTIFRYGVLEERKFTPVREEADFCSYGERKDGAEDG